MASKYDLHIFEARGRRIIMHWDTSVDGVDRWYHSDGKVHWWKTGRRYRSEARKKWKLLERVPEGTWRYYGAKKWLGK